MNMPIYTTHMSYRVPIRDNGVYLNSASRTINMRRFVEPFVTHTFDNRSRQFVVDRAYVCATHNRAWLHLPYYDLPRMEEMLVKNDIPYDLHPVSPVAGADIGFTMAPWFQPKDARQEASIRYLTTDTTPLRGLAIQTGGGKTATVIKTLSVLKKRTLITMSRNIDQWVSEIKKFTDLTDDDIYVIKGGASVIDLIENIDVVYSPKVIVGSIKTLRQWSEPTLPYADVPPFQNICELFNIGIRVIDEAHLNFHANLMLDLQMNPAITIPLTATFDVTNIKVKGIFDQYYPSTIRFGENDYRRYVDIYSYGYITGYNDVPIRKFKTREGYNHARFEAWLLKHPDKFAQIYQTAYRPVVESHFLNIRTSEDKLLIMCSTRQMCHTLAETLQDDYPDEQCGVYLSETDDAVLDELSIIVSTYLSSGVGTDIKNLRTVFVTISMSSRPANEQILGRLRELKDRTPVFVYVYHKGIPSQVMHAQSRHAIYKPRAKGFYHGTL